MTLKPINALPQLRNCVPSMHNTWAILTVWHLRKYGRAARAVAVLALLVTVLATLGFGYHYVFDVVVAVPFALAMYAGTLPSRVGANAKWVAAASGATMTLAWLVAIRFAAGFGSRETLLRSQLPRVRTRRRDRNASRPPC
jgi:hypothetical protein